MKIIKMERRLELALESERFFDLVRWGDAATVLNRFYTTESEKMNFLDGAQFTANKNEYLPIKRTLHTELRRVVMKNCKIVKLEL